MSGGIVNDFVIGLYFFDGYLNGDRFLELLNNALLRLIKSVLTTL